MGGDSPLSGQKYLQIQAQDTRCFSFVDCKDELLCLKDENEAIIVRGRHIYKNKHRILHRIK